MELYNNHGNGVFHAKLSNFGLNDNIVNYLVTKASAENQETYEWPEKEFELGISIEQKRSPELNVYDHAEVVVSNLKDDKRFYSKLVSAK